MSIRFFHVFKMEIPTNEWIMPWVMGSAVTVSVTYKLQQNYDHHGCITGRVGTFSMIRHGERGLVSRKRYK